MGMVKESEGVRGSEASSNSPSQPVSKTHNSILVGHKGFKRSNPLSDRFPIYGFHHVEFWCSDATNTSRRFAFGLGMTAVGKSDQGTGNQHYASYVLQSGELGAYFIHPLSPSACQEKTGRGSLLGIE
jgi:hypothetical protein